MMKSFQIAAFAAVIPAAGATAGLLFSEDFEDAGAAARWSPLYFSSETASLDGVVSYNFDYSGLVFGSLTVPQAPGSAGTNGLAMQVNITDDGPVDEGEAVAVSPLNLTLPSSYRVLAGTFIFYGGGGGSSEHTIIGVNTDRSGVPFTFVPGSGAGQAYTLPHNSGLAGGSGPDGFYRTTDGTLTALADNSASTPSPSTFGINYDTPPVIFPGDGGDGYLDSRWVSVTLDVINGTTVNMYVENALIDSYTIGAGESTTGDLLFGAADIFNSANPNNVILWDNIRVFDVIPAPASLTFVGLGGAMIGARRRR